MKTQCFSNSKILLQKNESFWLFAPEGSLRYPLWSMEFGNGSISTLHLLIKHFIAVYKQTYAAGTGISVYFKQNRGISFL